MVGRGMKVRAENVTAEKIEERWHTYRNDATRYAKLVDKAESFETWGRKRKMNVMARILASIDLARKEELAEHRSPADSANTSSYGMSGNDSYSLPKPSHQCSPKATVSGILRYAFCIKSASFVIVATT